MENTVTLKQFSGQVIGSNDPENVRYYPTDEILVNGKRIGFVDHKPGSTCRFVRVLSNPTRKEIRDKVAAFRKQYGGPEVAELTAQPPNPEYIRAYLDKLKSQQGATTKDDDDDE